MKWMMFSMKIKKQTVIQRIAPPLERPWKMSPIFQVGGEPDGGAEHQSKCGECGCLVPDLVMEEHSRTCWADNSNKRRIETPMERRRSKYPKTNFWASAPRK